MTTNRCRTGLRLFILFPLFGTFVFGCAGKKEVKTDPFFEKWEKMAQTSRGNSPVPKAKVINIPEAEAAPHDGSEAAGEDSLKKALPTKPVTLKMNSVSIKVLLRSLARLADQNILIKNDIKGTLSVNFTEVQWDQVFRSILKTGGLTYAWEGDIIRVMTLEDMEHDLKLTEVRGKQLAATAGSKLSAPLLTTVIKIDYAEAKDIKANLDEILSKDEEGKARGSIRIDEHNNALIIQAIREDIAKMGPIIETIDKPTPQILIKANIVETSKETARNLGIQWGGLYSGHTGNQGLLVTPGGTNGGFSSSASGPAITYDPISEVTGIGMQGFAVNTPADAIVGTGTTSLGLVFGTIGGNVLDLQLSAMQRDGTLNILSSPSITTLDNQKAFTENGEKIPFVTIDSTGGTTTRTVKFENAVLRLEITPHVIDGENLKMKILVQKDEVDMSRQVEGNPFIIKKLTETALIVKDGETIVISGLTKKRETDSTSGVPWLKDIPFLGWLFKGSSRSNQMEEVLIFITPHILPTDKIASGR